MVLVISGNSNTPLTYTNVRHRDANLSRNHAINKLMVSHDGNPRPPVLNNAPNVSVAGGGLAGGGLAGGAIAQGDVYHPSNLERLVMAGQGKSMSNLDRLRKAQGKG